MRVEAASVNDGGGGLAGSRVEALDAQLSFHQSHSGNRSEMTSSAVVLYVQLFAPRKEGGRRGGGKGGSCNFRFFSTPPPSNEGGPSQKSSNPLASKPAVFQQIMRSSQRAHEKPADTPMHLSRWTEARRMEALNCVGPSPLSPSKGFGSLANHRIHW
ncbi:hypothetical protein GQ53DRAFT_146652 [Thozetella sp. PMI_491]|nr:hypothetical protein GQ53DRAFT_146652 [Thozetella sp. PMI_491]